MFYNSSEIPPDDLARSEQNLQAIERTKQPVVEPPVTPASRPPPSFRSTETEQTATGMSESDSQSATAETPSLSNPPNLSDTQVIKLTGDVTSPPPESTKRELSEDEEPATASAEAPPSGAADLSGTQIIKLAETATDSGSNTTEKKTATDKIRKMKKGATAKPKEAAKVHPLLEQQKKKGTFDRIIDFIKS
jgi:hypothetical protein